MVAIDGCPVGCAKAILDHAEMDSYNLKIKTTAWLFFGIFALLLFVVARWEITAKEHKNKPVKRVETMIDPGVDACILCKMMAPILKKLQKQYDGRAAVIFIDVWRMIENPTWQGACKDTGVVIGLIGVYFISNPFFVV